MGIWAKISAQIIWDKVWRVCTFRRLFCAGWLSRGQFRDITGYVTGIGNASHVPLYVSRTFCMPSVLHLGGTTPLLWQVVLTGLMLGFAASDEELVSLIVFYGSGLRNHLYFENAHSWRCLVTDGIKNWLRLLCGQRWHLLWACSILPWGLQVNGEYLDDYTELDSLKV